MPSESTDSQSTARLHPDYSGRRTFSFILSQFADCFRDIAPFFEPFTAEQVYEPFYLKKVSNILAERPNIDLLQLAHCDIAYCIVYFGTSHQDLTTLNRIYDGRYNGIFLRYLSFVIRYKPHPDSQLLSRWDLFRQENLSNIIDHLESQIKSIPTIQSPEQYLSWIPNVEGLKQIVEKRPFKYYGGHQFKLGHYYRHLFQSVRYIDEQKVLTRSEKYEYLKTLRAQLSTPEQYLLFLNSISVLGRPWELDHIAQVPYLNLNEYLISKYNFIKNIPDTYYIDEIEIKNYYPLVQFEIGPKPALRVAHEGKWC